MQNIASEVPKMFNESIFKVTCQYESAKQKTLYRKSDANPRHFSLVSVLLFFFTCSCEMKCFVCLFFFFFFFNKTCIRDEGKYFIILQHVSSPMNIKKLPCLYKDKK